MKRLHRLTMALAAVFLLALFIFPMWRITLYAPQYPTGVTMLIWINKIGGDQPGTLQNINILNHYVGMREIDPDAIPELKYFPIVVLFLVAAGLGAAAWGRPKLYLVWTLLLMVACGLGVYDFYLWEYAYGHDLSPTAPIKISGQSYQPPLLGRKELLNFIAISMPHTAGWFVVGSMLLGGLSWWMARKLRRGMRHDKRTGFAVMSMLFFALSLSACAPHARPIAPGEDSCIYCKMGIADGRFATELVSQKGKVHTFDAVECMRAFMNETTGEQWALVLVSPFDAPDTLIDAESAFYLESEARPSPMGAGYSAYTSQRAAAQAMDALGVGRLLEWNGLKPILK